MNVRTQRYFATEATHCAQLEPTTCRRITLGLVAKKRLVSSKCTKGMRS